MKNAIILFLSVVFSSFFLSSCENKEESFISQKDSQSSINRYTLQSVKNGDFKVEVKDRFLSIKGKNLENKMILINFWATWCPPCRAEIPHLVKIREKYQDNFEIIGVLVEEKGVEDVKSFMKEFKINYPIVIGEDNFALSRAVSPTRSIPFSVLYDKDGKYLTSYIGAIPAEMIESDINKYMKKTK